MEITKIQWYKLENQYKEIESLIKEIDSTFYYKKTNGKWSIHENLAHLGRYHEVFLDRLERIFKEENPYFGRYKSEQDNSFESWVEKEKKLIISDTKEKRSELIKKLKSLTSYDLIRNGFHPKFGNMNIIEWLTFFLLHESHHIFTIFRIIRVEENTRKGI